MDQLVITECAVEKHVTAVFAKLGLGPTPSSTSVRVYPVPARDGDDDARYYGRDHYQH